VDDSELVLENTSIKSMSLNDDDNDFPACWNKAQCEILKTVTGRECFELVLTFIKVRGRLQICHNKLTYRFLMKFV